MIDGLLWGSHWWWGPWGGWYGDWSVGWIGIHHSIIGDFDYDWGYYESVEVDVGTLDLDVAIDDAELTELDSFVESQDVDLAEDFAAISLEGVAQPGEGELDDPLFDGASDDALTEQLPAIEPEPEALTPRHATFEVLGDRLGHLTTAQHLLAPPQFLLEGAPETAAAAVKEDTLIGLAQ